MLNFHFHNPVKIFFGKGEVSRIAEEIGKEIRVLVLSGNGSAERNGALPSVRRVLAGHSYFEFSGIEPNPRYETLMKALPLIKEKEIDYLLAVGGGSVIDGAKFIAAAACYEGEGTPWELVAKKRPFQKALPLATLLTLPAAGSEMNCYAVISNEERKEKTSFDSPLLYPRFSVLDPTFSLTLPPIQTAYGIIDTFSHVLEQYLTYPVDSPVQDRFAEGLLLTLLEEAPRVFQLPEEYDSRANLMLCSMLALNDLISIGTPSDWTAHEIGHFLTELYGMDHASTLAVLFPALLEVKKDEKASKLLQYGERVWNIKEKSQKVKIDRAIEKTEAFFQSLGVKTKLRDYGLKERDISILVERIEEREITPLGEGGDIHLETVRQILERSL
ncbi:MAG: iron-containing alcohol dehydrogenase [Deltaproteobacteria bacterium]|nr:iron-containing alcohol dehydrogenase [Deltaproteobacteria bacterium]